MTQLLMSFGYLAVLLLVGLESLGIPLPGETMLITASVYAGATHHLSIAGVIVAAVAGAVVGDNIGFAIGWFGGYRLLLRFGRYVRLDEPRVKVGRYVFMRHGGAVVFFGRFVSVLRAYAAFLAGTNRMGWVRFLVFNVLGGVVWATLWGVLAYLLGTAITRFSVPIDIAFGAAGGVVVIIGIILVRRQERRLIAAAEAAFPGPLQRHLGG